MIVSVSRRNDIPAFYSDWFMEVFRNGSAEVSNPYRPNLKRMISLKREDVDAFVFWTRFPRPFFECLDLVDRKQIPYYFMLTVNHYPDFLEPQMVDLDIQISSLKELAERIGRSRIVWRYDPIIVAPEMDIAFHKKNFQILAGSIAPFAGRVIISFLDLYRKVNNRLKKIGFTPLNIREDSGKLTELTSFMNETASGQELEIQTCAEKIPEEQIGIKRGKCIDDELLNSLFGLEIAYEKDPGQRSACRCQHSLDIGFYGSCRFKCIYCYAL